MKGLRSVNRVLVSFRRFVASAGGMAFARLPGFSSTTAHRKLRDRTLLRMARLLYPHDALDDEVYMDVLRPLLARAEGNPGFAGVLRKGVAMLDAGKQGSWLSASRDDQLLALDRIQDESFFKMMKGKVRNELYEHPAVWKLIGYEGSSVENEGYLPPGLDDIDWLPEG